MHPTYYQRYLAGEYVPVWRELIALGESALQEPHRSDALAVCREVVRRAAANLRTLHTRLTGLGYQFSDPSSALVEAGPDADAILQKIESEFGTLPLIARVWYGNIASVNFGQAEEQRVYRGSDWKPPMKSDISGLGSHPALVFQSLERGKAMWHQLREENDEYHRDAAAGGHPDAFAVFGRFLPLGSWASNCEPKAFPTPCPGIDAVIYNDGGGDRYFVDELREAFRWGGFPFWQWSLENPEFASSMEYRPNFAKLLPVLREGLLEL